MFPKNRTQTMKYCLLVFHLWTTHFIFFNLKELIPFSLHAFLIQTANMIQADRVRTSPTTLLSSPFISCNQILLWFSKQPPLPFFGKVHRPVLL